MSFIIEIINKKANKYRVSNCFFVRLYTHLSGFEERLKLSEVQVLLGAPLQ